MRGAERLCPLDKPGEKREKREKGEKRKRKGAGTGAEEREGARTNMSDDPLDMR